MMLIYMLSYSLCAATRVVAVRSSSSKIEASAKAAVSFGFCDYPMWVMPDVGTDRRCDHEAGCPKRTTDCENLYGKMENETCTVVCAGAPRGPTETWACVDRNEWKLVGPAIDCSQETP